MHFQNTNLEEIYCKSGNFRENFSFANSVKRHICDIKVSRTGHDLAISVKDRMISPHCESFIFTKLRIYEVSRQIKPLRKFPNLQYFILFQKSTTS